MAPRSFTRSEGLRLSLLALAASASIVGGVFVTATPAFGEDALPDTSAACLVARGLESMASLSSIVHAGESVHVEGSGWGPGTEQIRGFVIITLDDGETKRPDDMELPAGFPMLFVVIVLPGPSPTWRPMGPSQRIFPSRRPGKLGQPMRFISAMLSPERMSKPRCVSLTPPSMFGHAP